MKGIPIIHDAIVRNRAAGMLFIASAGNSGRDTDVAPSYPGAYDDDNILSVAATDRNDNLVDFSNYGAVSIDIGAPGLRILSTFPTYQTTEMQQYGYNTSYDAISGTSMAAPQVTGVAALAFSLVPGALYQTVKSAILNGVDWNEGLYGKTVTGGRLNARRTLDLLRAPITVNGDPGGTPTNDTILVRLNSLDPTILEVVVDGNMQFSGPASSVSFITLNGLNGNDTITVSSNVSIPVAAYGGPGNDTITGGAGNDLLDAGDGNDSLLGADGNDTLSGGADLDTLYGQAGNDLLLGDAANDDLYGGTGNDTYAFRGGTLGSDVITEDPTIDSDTVDFRSFAEAINLNLTYVGNRSSGLPVLNTASLVLYQNNNNTAIENARGTDFADTITGNSRDNVLFGIAANDSLYGLGGNDTLHGGQGDNALYGGSNNDTFVFTSMPSGSDFVVEDPSSDTDTLDFSDLFNGITLDLAVAGLPGSGSFAMTQWALNLYLSSDTGIENVMGSNEVYKDAWWNVLAFGDSILGNARPNTFWGNNRNDTLIGGVGADTLWGGAGFDLADYSGRTNRVGIWLDGNANDGETNEHDNVKGDIEWLKGGAGNDTLVGDSDNESLEGGAGNDYIAGGPGNDTIVGSTGNDAIYGNQGSDSITGDEGADLIYGNSYDDAYGAYGYGEYGYGYGLDFSPDTIDGGSENDTIYGASGGDSLETISERRF